MYQMYARQYADMCSTGSVFKRGLVKCQLVLYAGLLSDEASRREYQTQYPKWC